MGASPYEKAHEFAHFRQLNEKTRAWEWHRRMMFVPYLCRMTRIWLEWEAMRMALASMRQLDICTPEVEREARRDLFSYFTCLFR